MGKKKSKPQVIGYSYSLGIAMGLCEEVDELLEFRLDDDIVARPNLKTSGSFSAKTGKPSTSHGTSNPCSSVMFYDGKQTEPNAYLSAKTGFELIYKKLCYFLINGFVGDNVRSVPNYSCVVKRTSLDIDGYKEGAEIDGDINPAFAIYYMFVNLLKLDKRVLDINSFKTCAKRLHDERLGVSFKMTRANEAKEWVEEILRTIDAVMAINPNTGLLALRLLRDDYDIKQLAYANENNIKDLKFTRKSWDSTYSSVSVKFTDRDGFKENSITAQNPAVKRTLGFERSQSIEYMAITSKTNAKKVLTRLMRRLTYPYATMKFSVSTDEFKHIGVGDVLLFSNEKLGVNNMKIRVTNVGGDSGEQTIGIEAIEDVFALSHVNFTFEQESLYKPIDLNIGELKYYGALNAPIELGEELGVIPMAATPSGFVQKINVRDGAQGESIDLIPWAVGELIKDYALSDEIDDGNGFVIKELIPLWKVAASRAGWQRLKMTCAIDDELMNFQFRDDLGDGKWRVREIIRGLGGSKITPHKKGAKVWFAPVDANDLPTLTLISPNTTLYFKAQNYANESQTKEFKFSHSGEARRAYAPSNVWGERKGADVILHWRNCVRLHGANYKNPDNIVAGFDEGLQEGAVKIKWDGGELDVEKGESCLIKDAKKGVKFELIALSQNGLGYASKSVFITI